jgi:AcrR family transcriptional regulator
VTAPPGRRERKKQLTRQAISDVATRMFLERGFDAVTITEIAAAADVAVQTVFNHFPTKEELYFDDTSWITGPADALRAARSGAPVWATMEAFYREALEHRRTAGYLGSTALFARRIEESEALQAGRARLSTVMQENLAAVGDGPPDWRRRLFAAQYAAVQHVLDGELYRLLTEHADDPESVIELLDPTITEAFATLRGAG